MKAIRTDNGGEYCSRDFTDYLRQAGIRHYTTNAYTPQESGVAERYNRTLMLIEQCYSPLEKGNDIEAQNYLVITSLSL